MDSLEAAVFYAALILIYRRVEIMPENLRNLLDSADFEVDTMWTTEFAKALKKKIATSGPKGGESESQEDKVEEKQEEAEEEEEEEEEDMVLDSFDQCDPCWRNSSLDLYNTS
ncbi:hypothetical protein TWF225_004809 [Orbilia oligospora]|nr:hypothetical protein TWF225_004809 [Orbilia oligospora]KAF3272693.1 hypothetical protein TWF217_000166 [Orbilia oligospora]